MSFEEAWNVVKGRSLDPKDYDQDIEDLIDADGGVSFTQDVRMLVMQGMAVMEAVREVARLNGLDGRDLMRAYTEAYR
jgi:hypothetical protein